MNNSSNTQRVTVSPDTQGPTSGAGAWAVQGWGASGRHVAYKAFAMLFDLDRALYAEGARIGVVGKSMRASCAFDQALARAELWMLGPFARRR